METINWKVEGMSCTGCAQTINGFLTKKGMKDVRVSLTAGEAHFLNESGVPEQELKKGIESLGFHIAEETETRKYHNKFALYLAICIPLTLVLQLHMLGHESAFHWIHNAWIQLIICLPVYLTGMYYFGRSAINGIIQGSANMNVLISLGASASFLYSLAGTLLGLGEAFIFYETTAAIVTFVFFGNYLEERALRTTQNSLNRLVKTQKVTANMLAYDDQHEEMIFPVDSMTLKSGDLLLIRSGEQIPADAKILWGEGQVDEAIITGESLPVNKYKKDIIIGGSILLDGSLKVQVTNAVKDSALSKVVDLVKRAQEDKPKIQLLADRISAVFVPSVIGISVVCFLVNYAIHGDLSLSFMRSIAVLVIACPCAMGLATPAAIAAGLGRAARNGILFRKADSLELFKNINQIVFDKTGTLTTGSFTIKEFNIIDPSISEGEFKRLLFSLEKYSGHPLAKSISVAWYIQPVMRWKKIEEVKGKGIQAISLNGDVYQAGTALFTGFSGTDNDHSIYLAKNNTILGWVDMQDELRPEAFEVIQYFKKRNIKTILLSGDRKEKSEHIASILEMDEVIAEQSPLQKLQQIERLCTLSPTVMVGDGINDGPALAKATIGISMSDASQIALQTADVVMMNSGLGKLPLTVKLGAHTFMTIRQNLFWAFFYNLVAIPVAALGLLTPAFAAAVMAFSDVILLVNSSRLFVKKLR